MTRRIILVDIGNGMTLSGVLPSVAVGAAYSATLTARGGRAPYTYTASAGTLPAGLMLDPATGIVSGTAASAGTVSFTVRATDTSGRSVQRSYAVAVIGEPLVLTLTGTFAAATVGTAYTSDLSITNGPAPYALHGGTGVISGALPDGLALSIVSGKLRLSGTPTGTGGTASFTAAVDSGDGQTAASAQSVTVSAAISLATWDPARHGPTVVLSNANLDATIPAYNNYSILAATTSKSSGKWLFQINITGLSSGDNNWFVGICAQEAGFPAPWGDGGTWLGAQDERSAGIGWFPYSGAVYYKSESAQIRATNAGTGLVVGTAVVLTVAVDLDSSTKTIEWFVGNSLKRSFSIPAAMAVRDWLPAATMLQPGCTFRINGGQTTIAVPTPLAGLGYNPYWG